MSVEPALSADGRFVAFRSTATNLVPADTNGGDDIFVHDRQTGATSRVNVASDGTEAVSASPHSADPAISADGRFVAFESAATNLVEGDRNSRLDVFVHDRATGATTRVSVSTAGLEGDGDSADPSLSADGRFVAFASSANNLAPTDASALQDIFVHDRVAGETRQVNLNADGESANRHSLRPVLSPDGRYVAYESNASNLVSNEWSGRAEIFLYDRVSGMTTLESVGTGGTRANDNSMLAALDEGARRIAFTTAASSLTPGDTNDAFDVFLRNRETGVTTRISAGAFGPVTPDPSVWPAISADGRFVVFGSEAPNLVAGDTNGLMDAFRYETTTGTIERVSVSSAGGQGNSRTDAPRLSGNGLVVAFSSGATNLVPGDSNNRNDVFVHDVTPAPAAPPPPAPPLPPPSPTPPPPAAAHPPPPLPSAPPARCRTPRVAGLRLNPARTKIRRAGCSLGRVRRARSRFVGRVLRQSPRPGVVRAQWSRVHLVVGRR